MSEFLMPYVSGVFTPSLKFGGNSVGQTGTFNGYYTLIGNRCFFNLEISLTAKGSSTGTATITGLPFPNLNSTNNRVACAAEMEVMASVTAIMAYIGPNGSAVNLFNFTGSTVAVLTEANFNNTSDMMISGSYPIS